MSDHTHSYFPVDHDFRVEYNNEHGATGTYHDGEPHQHKYIRGEPDEYGTTYYYGPPIEPDTDE